MALRLLRGRLSCLSYTAENGKTSVHLPARLVSRLYRCRRERLLMRTQCPASALQQCQFSTSQKSFVFDGTVCTQNAKERNSEIFQEVSKCASSQEVMDVVQRFGKIPPEELLFVLLSVQENRYQELADKIPWLGQGKFAHSQLKAFYNIDERMGDIRKHPFNTLLENCLTENKVNFRNQELGHILTSMCLLGYSHINNPVYANLIDHMSNQIQYMTKQSELESICFPARMCHHDKGKSDFDFPSKVYSRQVELITQPNAIQCPNELLNYMSVMNSLYGLCGRLEVYKIFEVMNKTVLELVDGLEKSCDFAIISRYFDLGMIDPMNGLVQDAYEKIFVKLQDVLEIRHFRYIYTVHWKKRLLTMDMLSSTHRRAVEIFNEKKSTLRPLELVHLMHGLLDYSDYETKREVEKLFGNCDLEQMDIYIIGLLGTVARSWVDTELVERYQNILADKAEALSSHPTIFQNIVRLTLIMPFRRRDIRERFVAGVLMKITEASPSYHFSLVHLAKLLLPEMEPAVDEEFLDKLIAAIPHLNEANLGGLGNGFLVRKKNQPSKRLQGKLSQLEMVYRKTCRDWVKKSEVLKQFGVPYFLHVYQAMAIADSEFADNLVTVLREKCKTDSIIPTEAIRLGIFLYKISYYDEDLCDALVDCCIENGEGFQLLHEILCLLVKVSYKVKKREAFLKCVLEAYAMYDKLGWRTVQLYLVSNMLHLDFYPKELLESILTIEFMNKLDEYVKSHPERAARVEHAMYEINCHVAIHHPELKIPFFSGAHFEHNVLPDLRKLVLRPRNYFEAVRYNLQQITGDSANLRVHPLSQYYDKFEFEMLLDSSGNFLPVEAANKGASKGQQKVAVLLWHKLSYCSNVPRLVGQSRVLKENLQRLGYKIVEIPHFEWYSMALAGDEAKQKYLREKIQGTQADRSHRTIDVTNIFSNSNEQPNIEARTF